MKPTTKFPDFKDDQEISVFMEAHDGFELVERGLAEIIETPAFTKRGKSYISLDPEIAQLLDELVTTRVIVLI